MSAIIGEVSFSYRLPWGKPLSSFFSDSLINPYIMPITTAPQLGTTAHILPTTTSAQSSRRIDLTKAALWYFLGVEAVCLVLMLLLLVQSYLA